MNSQEQLDTFCSAMGNTAKEIGTYLQLLGIKGKQYSPCNCPIANALKRAKLFETDFTLKVNGDCVSVSYWKENKTGIETVEYKLPIAVQCFINLFDAGQFPEVIEQ